VCLSESTVSLITQELPVRFQWNFGQLLEVWYVYYIFSIDIWKLKELLRFLGERNIKKRKIWSLVLEVDCFYFGTSSWNVIFNFHFFRLFFTGWILQNTKVERWWSLFYFHNHLEETQESLSFSPLSENTVHRNKPKLKIYEDQNPFILIE